MNDDISAKLMKWLSLNGERISPKDVLPCTRSFGARSGNVLLFARQA
jgi:hypothetical protein